MEKGEASSSVLSFLSQLRYEHLVAGTAGGVTSALVTHPLDLIKLRLAGLYTAHTITSHVLL